MWLGAATSKGDASCSHRHVVNSAAVLLIVMAVFQGCVILSEKKLQMPRVHERWRIGAEAQEEQFAFDQN